MGTIARPDAILQLLALCPLLAVGDTLAKAIAISAVILITLPAAIVLSWGLRRWLDESGRLAAAAFLLAGLIGCAELLLDAGLHELRLSLGLFLPLAAVNLVLLERAAGFLPTRTSHVPALAQHRSAVVPVPKIAGEIALGTALQIALRTAGGMALTLLLLGAARELVGRGSLLHDAHLLGTWASGLGIQFFRIDMGFLLAMLPPGAFLALGLLLALRNWLGQRRATQAARSAPEVLELHQAPNATHENGTEPR
jgi:electron transport complex protein RnfE